ncbi:MAG TPA: polyprenol monophosphomannose synthase [Negativicutes bacterium]|nr:polyprenol monophosphomannose synthase [Negativicutes bacterium]
MAGHLIIIPTYNERDNIETLLALITRTDPAAHILIVDDNSPDRTYEIVERLIQSVYLGQLFLLKRAGKMGLGTAYIAGFKWALARDYDYIFEMDADFSHDPKYLPDFLAAIQTHDVVLGSRYVSGGGVKNWGVIRKFISRGGSLYARTILGLSLRDLTGGFKCFRREVLEAIDLDGIRSNGYSFQIEMTYRAKCKGFRIVETPIVFEDRTAGKSKMSRKIFLEAVLMVWKLRFDSTIGA